MNAQTFATLPVGAVFLDVAYSGHWCMKLTDKRAAFLDGCGEFEPNANDPVKRCACARCLAERAAP